MAAPRTSRVLRTVVQGAALTATFGAATALSVLVHADLPVARRVAARLVSTALSSSLGGRVELAPFSDLGLSRVTVPEARLYDAYAAKVLSLSDVRVDVPLGSLLLQWLEHRRTVTVLVNHVRVERADVTLVADPKTGEPTLAAAIAPKRDGGGAPSTATENTEDARLRVYLPVIEVGQLAAHARLAGQEPFEADLHRVQGLLLATNRGVAVDVKRFGVVLRSGELSARGTGTLAVRAPGPLRGTFEGFFGDIELKASAFLEGPHLEGVLDVPRATPEAARRILPAWPLQAPVAGHFDAKGDLPNLTVTASLGAERATFEGRGTVHLAAPVEATFDVTSRHLDARLLSPGAPETDVTLNAHGRAHVDGNEIAGEVTAHTDTTVVSGKLVPSLDVTATFVDASATGTASIHEPGLPVEASFQASRQGALDVDARVAHFDLSRLPRLGVPGITGTGAARVHAHVGDGKARATIDADVNRFSAKGGAVERAHVTAQLSAPLSAPENVSGAIHATGTGAAAGTLTAKTVSIEAKGSPESVTFEARAAAQNETEIRAAGVASLAQGLRITGTKLLLRRAPVTIEGRIEAWDAESGRLDVRDIHVAGAGGTLTGAARLGRDLIEVEATGQDVDLAAIASALGLPRGTLAGTMSVDADVAVGHDVTRGTLRVGLGNATLGMVSGLSAQASADLEDTHLTGGASGIVLGLGTFGTTWNATLGGKAFEVASWRDATGEAEVQIGNVRLSLLSLLLRDDAPISHLGGQAFSRILLSRKSAEDLLPEVFATVATRDLTVDVRRDGGVTHVSGIDVTATGAFSGKTGVSNGTTVLTDRQGVLVSGSGAIQLDVARFVDDPLKALSQLADTPVDGVVSLPPRALAELPELIRPAGISGTVSGNVSLKGTLTKPTLFASVDGAGMAAEDAPTSRPVDLHASGQYEWNTREVSARAAASLDGRDVATATFRGLIPEALSTWNGAGHVDFDGLPLELVTAIGRNDVTGRVVGTASIQRTPGNAELSASLRLEGTAVGSVPIGDGHMEASVEGSAARASLEIVGERGRLRADADTEVSWSTGVPVPAPDAKMHAHAVAREFSAVSILPFVRPVLARTSGRLDADLKATFQNGEGGIDGTARLSEGSALVETLGIDVRDLSLSVRAREQNGETVLSVSDLSGRVRSSNDNLRGNAELVLRGVRLVRGTGELTTEDLPILFRGAPQGRVTGGAALRLSRDDVGYLVDVEIPKLVATLPQTSTRNVIDLADNPDVTVLQLAREKTTHGDVTPWRIALHLGSEVRVKRNDIDVGITGTPVLLFGNETNVDGSVDLLPGSRVPALSQVFVVEHGRVVFDTGEAENPRLDVTAAWRAPSGTVVYVDLTGTLKEPKIAFRSDPPLPESEVAALVLGGESSASGATAASSSSSDSSASPNGGAGAGAVALGTGVAAMGVNQLISNNPVQLRVETTSESRPRYTAAVRVRENLWFEASTYQQSQMNADSAATDRSVYSGTIDYRFTPRWSLRTEAGTAGGALDLLWQYRY